MLYIDLVLTGDMYLPASSKRPTGTIKQKKVHCYLFTNSLVVIGGDKKVLVRCQDNMCVHVYSHSVFSWSIINYWYSLSS